MLQPLICTGMYGAVRGGVVVCAVPAGKLRLGPAHGTGPVAGRTPARAQRTGSSCKHGHQ